MFQKIQGIDIGQGAGNAFGGGIYAASCQIGFSNEPTRITINVASEDGKYQPVSPNVYSAQYNINLNGKSFSNMYLYSYERNKSEGSAVMTVNFVDSSIILDKVFVGLLNRHGNSSKATEIITGTFNARCPSCTDGYITNISGYAFRYVDYIPGGSYYQKNQGGGGYMIVGKENFPESNCEIPKVDYNFTEFCAALTTYGIQHELSQFDLNPMYRQEYAGTLREVLNNWASDFSFQFFFDGNTLKGIDLRKPISLTAVQTFAENNEFVKSSTYGETLENTYSQSVVARYLQPSSASEYNNTYHYKNLANQIYLNDITNGCAGRTDGMLLTCVGLARLDGALREAYIGNYVYENNDLSPLAALGFQTSAGKIYRLPANATAPLLKQLQTWNNDILNNPAGTDDAISDAHYAVYVGLFREDIKEQVENWDKEAANFIGKYYSFDSDLPANSYACPFAQDWFIYYTYDSKWSTLPTSNTYGGEALPFSQLLIDPTSNTNLINFRTKNLFTVDDNSWGIEQTTYDAAKGTYNYDRLKPTIVLWKDVPDAQGVWLAALQQTSPGATLPTDIFTNIANKTSTENGAQVAFLIVPLMRYFSNAPNISAFGRTVNNSVYNRVSTHQTSEDKSNRCVTYCDSSIVSEMCNCGTKYTPTPYFQNLMAPFFQVKHKNGNTSNIIFPCDAAYFGYFVHDSYFKTTNPPVKSIYGEPPNSPTNAMSTRVIDYDITPDIDAVMDDNDAINEYIYSPTRQAIITAEDYYQSLANLNNLVIPPQQNVRMEIARTDLSNLGLPLSPADGLTEMTLSLSDGGLVTQLSYSSRPSVMPKAEAVFTKIKYRLNKY